MEPPSGLEVEDGLIGKPAEAALVQNRSNPFNAVTALVFLLPQARQVELEIYNETGQKVRTYNTSHAFLLFFETICVNNTDQ